jgi:lipoprotein-anchoring transpeptidase ErfK/SrfK
VIKFFPPFLSSWFFHLAVIASALLLCQCGTQVDRRSKMIVSVRDQKLLLTSDGVPVKAYQISTSKFGLGSNSGSNRTPLGKLVVARKIGDYAPKGMVFKSRKPTGEILKPNAPGRDPIVSRILWLHGKERQNRNTYRRCIYIHGTPEEWRLGSPASYGCIRMSSRDVIDLYKRIGVGSEVQVIRGPLTSTSEGQRYAGSNSSSVAGVSGG